MTRRRAARAVALTAAAGLLAAGCGTDEHGCGLCGRVSVAPGDGVVWAAQGKNVLRLDPATGRTLGATAVMADQRGTDVEAISAWGAVGVYAVWTSGQALVGSRDGIVARAGRRPRGYAVAAATAGGLTWMVAGRSAIALAPDATVLMRRRLLGRASAVALDGRVAWAVGASAGHPGYAVGIDAATGRRLHRWTLGTGPSGVAARDGVLWISTKAGLERLDPATGRVIAHVRASPARIALGAGRLWTLDVRRGTLTRRHRATGPPAGSSPTRGDLLGTVAADATGVWVGLNDPYRARAVVRIDPATLGTLWTVAIPVT